MRVSSPQSASGSLKGTILSKEAHHFKWPMRQVCDAKRASRARSKAKLKFTAQAHRGEQIPAWNNGTVRQQGPVQPAVWVEVSQFSSSSLDQRGRDGRQLRQPQSQWSNPTDRSLGYERTPDGSGGWDPRSNLKRNYPNDQTGVREVTNASDSSTWQGRQADPGAGLREYAASASDLNQGPNSFTEEEPPGAQAFARKQKRPVKARSLWSRSFDFLKKKQRQPEDDDWAAPAPVPVNDEDDWGPTTLKQQKSSGQNTSANGQFEATSTPQSQLTAQGPPPRQSSSNAEVEAQSPPIDPGLGVNRGSMSRQIDSRTSSGISPQSRDQRNAFYDGTDNRDERGRFVDKHDRIQDSKQGWTVSSGRESLDSDPAGNSRQAANDSRMKQSSKQEFSGDYNGANQGSQGYAGQQAGGNYEQRGSFSQGRIDPELGAEYARIEAEVLEELESDWDAASEDWEEGDGPDITLLSPSETDTLLPVVPTAEQMGYAWGNAVDLWQRLGSAAFVTIITVKLNLILVASGAASYPFWGPLLTAANRNRALRKTGRHVGFWRTRVIDFTVERPTRSRYTGSPVQGSGLTRPTIRFLLGDSSGARSSVSVPLNKKYEAVQIGEPAEVLVLSSKPGFDSFKALKEVYFPESGLWMSEYPHINRSLFLDISLDIERARRQEMMAGAFDA